MRNYYDILELECVASGEDIKKAYRKMALKWHPGSISTFKFCYLIHMEKMNIILKIKINIIPKFEDKNRDEPEKAHKEFLLVQQAYEVLSDPVEKRWYDENKDKMVDGAFCYICLKTYRIFFQICLFRFCSGLQGQSSECGSLHHSFLLQRL